MTNGQQSRSGLSEGAGLPGSEQWPGASGRRVIVDAQVHLWKADTPDRRWAPGTKAQLTEPMTIERLLPMLDDGGVDRVVVVPPLLEGLRIDYGQEASQRHPGRFATMARVALDDRTEASRLAGLRSEFGVLGVRLNFAGDMARWLIDGTADWFWPAAESLALPVMFLTNGQTPLFAEIAERHPRLALIVDHMGLAADTVKDDAVAARVGETKALARYPNVSVKLSAAPFFSAEPYPFRDMRLHIARLYDAYGPHRCFWGTDVTSCIEKATYRQRVTHFTEELPFLTEADKDWIMGRAIIERLGWTSTIETPVRA